MGKIKANVVRFSKKRLLLTNMNSIKSMTILVRIPTRQIKTSYIDDLGFNIFEELDTLCQCTVYGHISQYVVLGGEGKVDKISFREERFSPEDNFMVVNIKASGSPKKYSCRNDSQHQIDILIVLTRPILQNIL